METLERVGAEAIRDLERYLWRHYHENIALLHDLQRGGLRNGEREKPTLLGYRLGGAIVAVQAIYRGGRWLPHYERPDVLPAMLEDARDYWLRWLMGPRRIVDPILDRLPELGLHVTFDEIDAFCYVDRSSLVPYVAPGVRRATPRDVEDVATLRCAFEAEYFGVPVERIERAWCLRAAERYIRDGAYVAEVGGRSVAMVAIEGSLPQLTHIGAVYTVHAYRNRGLAKGVVTAICQEHLRRKERVTLNVRVDNVAANRAYRALGFRVWGDYRMCRLS
jgi:RimJ/RimL family protein N-acetyltransferase